jgi:hypothetical protein
MGHKIEEGVQFVAGIIAAVGAGRELMRQAAIPDLAVLTMSELALAAGQAAVAINIRSRQGHVEYFGPLGRNLFPRGIIILLSGQIGLTFTATQSATGDHVRSPLVWVKWTFPHWSLSRKRFTTGHRDK